MLACSVASSCCSCSLGAPANLARARSPLQTYVPTHCARTAQLEFSRPGHPHKAVVLGTAGALCPSLRSRLRIILEVRIGGNAR